MSWNIFYTDRAKNDLQAIYKYVAFSLEAPEVAYKLVNRIMD